MLVLAVLVVAGCGSTPPSPSRVERDAQAFSQRGARAFEQGQWDVARGFYSEALRLDRSVENRDGIATNLLNLARVAQASGKPVESHVQLDQLLADAPLTLPRERQAEAAGRKAQLYLAESNLDLAAHWAARGEALCGETCPTLAALMNLRAMAALRSGDQSGALTQAARALAASDERSPERANAHRLMGEAQLQGRNAANALVALRNALALDQALGLPTRIHRDLELLGQASEALGQVEEARAFRSRAQAVLSATTKPLTPTAAAEGRAP
jgi:tetratricopeptide (TPR) repeat protein